MFYKINFLVCAVSLLFLTLGCAKKDSTPQLVSVTGQVMSKGKPVEGAEIRFMPVSGEAGSSEAISDDDGVFTLKYNTNNEGAIPGRHKVKVDVYGKRGPSEVEGQPGPPLSPPREYNLGEMVISEDGAEFKLTLPARRG